MVYSGDSWVYSVDPADLDFANDVGERLGDRLLPRPSLIHFVIKPPRADAVIEQVVREVERYKPRITSVHEPALRRLIVETNRPTVEGVQRLISASRRMGLGGIPVLDEETGPLRGLTPVDLFNQRTVDALFAHSEIHRGAAPSRDFVPLSREWHATVRRVVPEMRRLRTVDERTAARGFLTLLTHSIRALMGGIHEDGDRGSSFRVNCQPDYSVDWFEQSYYSPRAFGATPSTPVDGWLPFGYYRFQGWKDTLLTIDRRTYEVAPHIREATMVDF
jgi:hypothetical protein